MARSKSSSWGDSGGGSATAAASSAVGTARALTLDRVIGQTCVHNSALAVNPITGDVAYPAGCVVVIYQPRRNRQVRYFRASKAVSCLAFSRDGGMLAVGERGHQPLATVWSLATGAVVRELAGGHRFGIGCISFTPSGGGVVTMGFKHDRMLRVWDLRLAAGLTGDRLPDHSSDRSAEPISGYPSSGTDSPPPPPPPTPPPLPDPLNDSQHPVFSAPAATVATPSRGHEARQIASARVPQRVRAMDFTSDGECLVTCGDSHVKFWTMTGGQPGSREAGGGFIGIGADVARPDKTAAFATTEAPLPSTKTGTVEGGEGEGEVPAVAASVVHSLEGWAATIVNELEGATFVDVSSSGKGGGGGGGSGGGRAAAAGSDSVFCVTSEGVLCAFTRRGVMEHWVSLEAPAAYGVSVHEDGTLAAACADGVVRLFKTDNLQYVATLPRPPPLGRANIASVRELQDIADLSSAAAKAAAAAAAAAAEPAAAEPAAAASGGGDASCDSFTTAAEESDNVNVGTVRDEKCFSEAGDGGGGGGGVCRTAIKYPAALGCRLSPSGTKVVCIYADRGLFIWDATDPLCVGKYRSFLAHGGCIWDVQRMPARMPRPIPEDGDRSSPLPDIPAGAMVTCSADNTVRVWDLDALDGKPVGHKQSHSGRWVNIYSKHLLRVLYGSGDGAGGPGGNPCPGAARNAWFGDEATAEEMALSEGAFDPEITHKPEWSRSPRSLAVHPEGSQVACGDKAGNIRVYDLSAMELVHSQAAHDAEVLCLAYSPMMIPAGTGGSSTTTLPLRSCLDGANVTGEMKTSSSARGGSGTGLSLFSAAENSAVSTGAAARANAVRGSAARIVSSWEAVDPLDPASAAEKMLSLSLMSSSLSSASESETKRGGGGRGAGFADRGGGGDVSTDADRRPDESNRDHEANSIGGVRTDADGAGGRQHQPGCYPLVLLASASRDRLVHVFDASARSRGGGAATATAMAAVPSPSESGDVDSCSRGGTQEAGGRAGREEMEMAEPPGAEAENSGGTQKANQGVAVGATEAEIGVAAGFPLLKTLDSHSGSVTAVKFSNDGKRLITAGGDKLLVLHNVRGPHVNRLRAVHVPQGTIYGLDVDPTNNYIVTAGQDKRLNIWSTTSGKHVRAYKVEPSTPTPTAAPATPSAVEGEGGEPSGFSKSGGGSSGEGGGGGRGDAGGELFKVDLDPTGMYAAACSFDKWIRLVDFYSGKCLAKVAGHSELATGVRFTPDGRRLVTTGGDGVMFVWQLSSELQQSMHDRMCELRPGGDTAGGGVGHGTGDGMRGSSNSGSDGSLAGALAKATAAPAAPLPAGVPPVAAGDTASSAEYFVDQGGVKGSGTGKKGPQTTLSKVAAEARAKAKAGAKARLKFQRYQLPAWAHTQSGPALAAATFATTAATATMSSPSSTPEEEAESTATAAEKLVSDSAEAKDGQDEAVDGDGGAVGNCAERAGNVGVEAGIGRESPPPVLEALVSGIGAGVGSFSCGRRRSSHKEDGDCSSRNVIREICNTADTSCSSKDSGGGRGGDGGWTEPSPPSLPLPPPLQPGEKEEATREPQRAQEQQREATRNSEEVREALSPADNSFAATPATAATKASRLYKGAPLGGGGLLSAKPRARWAVRRGGTEAVSTPAAALSTVTSAAGGSKGDVLVAARGRWARRSVFEEGAMEIVGHRTGKEKTVPEKSALLILSANKRQEEERQGLKVEAGANDVGVGKGAVALAECGENEDGVMLGDSEVDDADYLKYSMDDDFEDAGRSRKGAENMLTRGKAGSSSLDTCGDGGDGAHRSEEVRGGDRNSVLDVELAVPLAFDPTAAVPEELRHSEREGAKPDTVGSGSRDGTGGGVGSPAKTAAEAAAAAAGLQRKLAERATGNSTSSVAVTTAIAPAPASVDDDPLAKKDKSKGGGEFDGQNRSASVDGAAKMFFRAGNSRTRPSNIRNPPAAAPGGEGGLPAPTASGEFSESSAADQRDDEVVERGRRISQTEGAVETMRKKLSAMGLLEPSIVSPSCGHNETVGTAMKVSDGRATKQSIDSLSETPGEAARDRGRSASAAAVAAVATAAAVGQENEYARVCAVDAWDGDKARGRAVDTATPTFPPAARVDENAPPPPPPPQRQGSTSSLGPDGGEVRAAAAAKESSDFLPVDVEGSSIDVHEPRPPSNLQIPDPQPPESGSFALSSGRRRRRRRRNNPPDSKEERLRGRNDVPSPPLSSRMVVLPRPDAEYQAALLRLTEAASHAAELYRELTEASSASLASRRTGTGTGTEEGSGAGVQSSPSTSSAGLGRASFGLGGVSAGSGRQEGEHGSSRSSSAAVAFAVSSSAAPSASASDGDADGDEGSYEDDAEWEDEEENEYEIEPDVAAERRRKGEQGKRGESLGPVSLEISFRESFASVNDVLSSIASGTAEGNTTASSTSLSLKKFRGGGGADGGTGSGGNRPVERRGNLESSSSLTGEVEDGRYEPLGSAASPRHPPCRRNQPRRTASGRDDFSELAVGGLKQAFPLTPGGGSGTGAGSAATGVAGIFGVGSSEEEMPAEMSGMLQRYSEMMVKVVQEKMEARMANGTLGPST